MKKFLILFLLIGIFSCTYAPPRIGVQDKPSEYPKHLIIDGMEWDITLGSDGHEYIDDNGNASYVLFHNPSCVKCIGIIGAHIQKQ